MNDTSLSKFLSLVLRHDPQKIGLSLDSAGWTPINELLRAAEIHGTHFSREDLDRVVASSDKQRFAISEDGLRIRANQGHSVDVDLAYEPAVPPEFLFHGTASRFLASIREGGLKKGARHHVHLSKDETTATKVGSRHGSPVVLVVAAGEMYRGGHVFYCSTNGVWLVDHVPVSHVRWPAPG